MRCKVIGRKLFSLGRQPQYRLEDGHNQMIDKEDVGMVRGRMDR